MKLEIVQAKRNLLPVSFRRNLQTSDKLYHLAPLTWLHWMVPSFLQRCLKRLRSAILLTKLFSNDAIKLSHEYRDRIYIRKDIVLKLTEYGELNQTTLLSYTGLNLATLHKCKKTFGLSRWKGNLQSKNRRRLYSMGWLHLWKEFGIEKRKENNARVDNNRMA